MKKNYLEEARDSDLGVKARTWLHIEDAGSWQMIHSMGEREPSEILYTASQASE